MKQKKHLSKRRFVGMFFAIVLILAGVRYITRHYADEVQEEQTEQTELAADMPHRIMSVPNYKKAFPDSQSVQIVAAERWGVRPVKNREDAEKRKKELVYVGESPYYHVDRLKSSIPYLVPRAAILRRTLGRLSTIASMSRVFPSISSLSPASCALWMMWPNCSATIRMPQSVRAISSVLRLISVTTAIILLLSLFATTL